MAGPTIETAIWLALRGRVATLVLNPLHQVAWPNEPFTPPQTGSQPAPYLRVNHLPNRSDRLLINRGLSRYQGILQIDAMYPLAVLNGQTVASQIAGVIAEHFPADLRLEYAGVSVRITKKPDVAQGFRDEASTRWMTPVSISYESFN